jgi:hypothetical protein
VDLEVFWPGILVRQLLKNSLKEQHFRDMSRL